jgi:outer membrane protein TolC
MASTASAAEVRVETEVKSAWEAWRAATTRARFFDRDYVPAALAVEAMAREGFAAGKSGLLPLLEAARAVLEARFGRAQALYDVQAARADLEEASGVALSTP